jgi:hypothetical protein
MSLSTRDRIDSRPTSLPPAILSGRIAGWDEGDASLLITLREPCPVLESFIERLTELRSLPANWDSYGSLLINHKAAVNSVRLFCQIMYDETPAPQVVPTNSGNVQLEWHIHGIDLEIEICGDGSVHCFFGDKGSGREQEWSESFNYATVLVMPFIEELTGRAMLDKVAA